MTWWVAQSSELLSILPQVGLGPAGHAGHSLLSLHAEDHPSAHLQGEGQWAVACPLLEARGLGEHGSRVLGYDHRSSPGWAFGPKHRSWVQYWPWVLGWVTPQALAFAGLYAAAAGALHLRRLLRLHHPLPNQGRPALPSQLPVPSPTLADRPVLCRVATASWWRWLPGPRTHLPTRRYTTRSCGPPAESPSRAGGCEPPG